MIEITLVGEEFMSAWGWEIAIDLFLGGLVAGLMIISGVMRILRPGQFKRSLLVADLASLPVLGIGMLFLFIDLSNKINMWRLYTTFQFQSAMSWGAWILLFSMVILTFRFVSRIPEFANIHLIKSRFIPPSLINGDSPDQKTSWLVKIIGWVKNVIWNISEWTFQNDRILSFLGVPFGIGIGFYTGALLSSMLSHPLWNNAVLAPLFLVSGAASGGAFLLLFIPVEERKQVLIISLIINGLEFLLLLALVINLVFGNRGVHRAGALLLSGTFGWLFWGIVVLLGLLLPIGLDQLEMIGRRFPIIGNTLSPVLKLIGRLTLRFVIVYAGLLSFI